MPCQIYNYFEPNIVSILNELVVLIRSIDKSAPGKIKICEMQKTRLNKKHRQQNVYYQEHKVYPHKKKDYDEFHRLYAKL